MPVISVARDRLFEALGQTYTDEEFEELCFEYGIELDDVTSEKELLRNERGGGAAEASDEILYKIDIPANRYDMLCLEGIARALNVFRGRIAAPQYRLADMTGKPLQRIVIRPETTLVRPFLVAAVLRGVTFDPARYNSFIELQDKLHQNLCRQRSLVAIGTHDLATLKGPFTYEARVPEDITFTALKQTQPMQARALLDHYTANDNKLRKYVPLIRDSLVYPVIFDSRRTVLSLPPIINGAHSAITLATRDVLIECTATDLTKAKIVLNTVCCMFAEYCAAPYEVEPVEVEDSFGELRVYPDLAPRAMEVPTAAINSMLGLQMPAADMATLLRRMQLDATASADAGLLQLRVPPTRSDILHACDVVEDVAIAYGYNNVPKRIPTAYTPGRELPLNQMTELLRGEVAMAGFTEILTWALISKHENFTAIRRVDDGATAVEIGNPATAEFEVARSSLLPSALKTLGANKDAALPLRLFEVSDVLRLSDAKEVGATNERHLVAVVCSGTSGFEIIHGLLNRVMEVLGVPYKGTDARQEALYGGTYEWAPSDDPSFFPGRQASVSTKGRQVGIFGIIHPEVLANFDIDYPVSALELNIEPFLFDQYYKPLS